MNGKSWYTSKAFWLGVLITLGGIGEFLAGLPPEASILTMIAGISVIVIRFLTNQGLVK